MDFMTFMILLSLIGSLAGLVFTRMNQGERHEARRMYERITLEKLEAIKTALAMGYTRDDLADLDQRLEGIVGADHLADLLKTNRPPQTTDDWTNPALADADLEQEIERLQRKREKQ